MGANHSISIAVIVLPVITSFAPSRAQRSAISRPMPRLEPVMKIVLPRKSFISYQARTPPDASTPKYVPLLLVELGSNNAEPMATAILIE